MANDLSVSPEFARFAQALYSALAATQNGARVLNGGPHPTSLRVRPHMRRLSTAQKVMRAATRTRLVKRDAKGRIVGVSPKLKRALKKLQAQRRRAMTRSPAQLAIIEKQILQIATGALPPTTKLATIIPPATVPPRQLS